MTTDGFKFLPTVGLLIINNNKLLLAYSKNKKAWYLPGGKIDDGETPIQSLEREIKEELNIILNPSSITYYCHIKAQAFGESSSVIMEQECYLYPYNKKIIPTNEIEEVKYFDLMDYKLEDIQVVGVIEIFDRLIRDELLF